MLALKPAAEAVEWAGLLLELQAAREQLEAAVEERERLEEDLHGGRMLPSTRPAGGATCGARGPAGAGCVGSTG